MILTPKNWHSFQHYKDRSPSWIKLHRGLLTDYDFFCLPVASRALAPILWLLASEYEDGKITGSLDAIAFKLHMPRGDLADALSPLLEKGFFDASEPLAECRQEDIPEKEDIGKRNIEKRERENGASAPLDPAVPEREYFARGREVLGKGNGALIGKLLKAKGGNVALARAALEQASQKDSPIEYIGAVCRGPPPGKPLTEFQRGRNETKDILNDLENFSTGGGFSSEANPRLLPRDSGERSEGFRGGVSADVIDFSATGHRTSG